jgi:hypothetical protein
MSVNGQGIVRLPVCHAHAAQFDSDASDGNRILLTKANCDAAITARPGKTAAPGYQPSSAAQLA